jgi:hypothetical protein
MEIFMARGRVLYRAMRRTLWVGHGRYYRDSLQGGRMYAFRMEDRGTTRGTCPREDAHARNAM